MIVEPLVGETMDANCAKADVAREAMTRKVFILWLALLGYFVCLRFVAAAAIPHPALILQRDIAKRDFQAVYELYPQQEKV